MGLSGMRHCFNMGLSGMCHCFSKLSCPFHMYAYGFFLKFFKRCHFPSISFIVKNFIITYKSSWNSYSEILNRNSKRMKRYEESKRRGALFWDTWYVKHMTMTTGKTWVWWQQWYLFTWRDMPCESLQSGRIHLLLSAEKIWFCQRGSLTLMAAGW